MENVLVTGGGGGIGTAVVKDLVDHGYRVLAMDKDEKNLEQVKTIAPEQIIPLVYDTTDVSSLNDLSKKFEETFSITHLISLAGRALPNEWKPFWEQNLEDIKESLIVNLFGHINIIHTFLPALLNNEGKDTSITLISSINALGDFGLPGYSAAKSGMFGLTNALCKEFGQAGIRVNTVSPGTIVTPATEAEPKDFESLMKKTALGRFATKEDVAHAVRFLMQNTGITGQNIVVDAGQLRV